MTSEMPKEIWVEPPPIEDRCSPSITKVEVSGFIKYHHDDKVQGLVELLKEIDGQLGDMPPWSIRLKQAITEWRKEND